MFFNLSRQAQGATVPDLKLTRKLEVATMPLPSRIVLPMQQHIGTPSTVAVQLGQHVDVGSLVGKAPGFVGADIHASVSGEVVRIGEMTMPDGSSCTAVEIRPDGMQTLNSSVVMPEVRDRRTFVQAAASCGLVGLGGAGFPTAVKLSPKKLNAFDTLIVNAAECEPYLTSDAHTMMYFGDHVMTGILAVKKYLDIDRAIVAVERSMPEEMDLMFSFTRGDRSLSVFPLPTRYPQGAEKVLINQVLGREVPVGGLPADVGVLVMNVSTLAALGRFLITGVPLITRLVTVDGGAVVEPKCLEVPIGAPISEVVGFCGGYRHAPAKLIVGGPMMGDALPNDDFPVIKTTNGILALTAAEATQPPVQACMRCSRCVAACPMGLSPIEIDEAYECRDTDELFTLYADVCIKCGVCSYVCPARRPLTRQTALAHDYLKQAEGKQ